MNCYEWAKHITGTVSIEFDLEFSEGEGEEQVTILGSHTFSHENIKTNWTRRELQCIRNTIPPESFLLRELNLCEGRAYLEGALYTEPMIVETTIGTNPPEYSEANLFLWARSSITGTWEPLDQGPFIPFRFAYPTWSNDPYSVARRAQIDKALAGEVKNIYIDVYPTGLDPDTGLPAAPGFLWPMNGDTAEYKGGGWKKKCKVNYVFSRT